MTAPDIVLELIERYNRNRTAYRSNQYNEAQLRIEFLNPLFEALGWDVNNKQGYAEAYKDVVNEDAIKVSGATKAPDYSFRIGGTLDSICDNLLSVIWLNKDLHPLNARSEAAVALTLRTVAKSRQQVPSTTGQDKAYR